MNPSLSYRINFSFIGLILVCLVGNSGAQGWHPAVAPLMTRWPTNALPEYPRPQMARERWLNLNGLWDYSLTKDTDMTAPEKFAGQILVPFSYESALSGVGKPSIPNQCPLYRRKFTIESWRDQRVVLHFGAANWEATVRLMYTQISIASDQKSPETGWLISMANLYDRPVICTEWTPEDAATVEGTLKLFAVLHVRWFSIPSNLARGGLPQKSGETASPTETGGLLDRVALANNQNLSDLVRKFHFQRFMTPRQ